MSRFELKPPVATTTALPWISKDSPVPRRRDAADSAILCEQFAGFGRSHDCDIGQRFGGLDQRRHQAESVVVRPVPAQHAVAFLNFHVDPFGAAALGPVIEIVQRVFEIIARPHFVGRAAAPFDPVFEGEIRRVLDALRFLQRRADDAAAAAGDRRGAAAFRGASNTMALPPALATSMAAGMPAPPPPMMTTSVCRLEFAIETPSKMIAVRRFITVIVIGSNYR